MYSFFVLCLMLELLSVPTSKYFLLWTHLDQLIFLWLQVSKPHKLKSFISCNDDNNSDTMCISWWQHVNICVQDITPLQPQSDHVEQIAFFKWRKGGNQRQNGGIKGILMTNCEVHFFTMPFIFLQSSVQDCRSIMHVYVCVCMCLLYILSILPPAEGSTQKEKKQKYWFRRAISGGCGIPLAGGAKVRDSGPLRVYWDDVKLAPFINLLLYLCQLLLFFIHHHLTGSRKCN